MVTDRTEKQNIVELITRQRDFFNSGKTLKLEYRLKQLKRLYKAIKIHEDEISEALFKDFKKPAYEAFETEIGLVLHEIKYFLRHLPALLRPEKVRSSVLSFPTKGYIYREPYGNSLIIGPWNYPFMLLFEPLVGAIAAGNSIILKPSELSVHTAEIIKKIIHNTFDEDYVAIVEGGPEETQLLLAQQFDHIFFTGSEKVGRIVYAAAAKNLTPCILELGGKSPCIVDADANLDLAARRIVWGKLLNGGQSCVAPDYLLVHNKIKTPLLEKIKHYINVFLGDEPQDSPDFAHVINDRNFNRLTRYLAQGNIICGGQTNAGERYIAPTIIDDVSWDDLVMQEEIFGPILPVLSFEDLDDIIQKIRERPKPLALYYFSKNKKRKKKILAEVSFGGGCINDTMFQFGNSHMPVGGVGNSGIGNYHGKGSFEAFSHSKAIVKQTNLFDLPVRYAPYQGKMGLLKLLFKI